MTLTAARTELKKFADAKRAPTYRNFFKNSKDDVFWGVTAPLMRKVAKKHWELPLSNLPTLMKSRIHDERSLAHAILVIKFQKADDAEKTKIFDFYMKNRKFIKNWDGVDDSAPYIVGPYLFNRDKSILYELICAERIWDRRIALVATWPMIRQGHITDTLKLVRKVLHDQEDLIHKAAGWMLREVGKVDSNALTDFLKRHHSKMPRIMLRYAIERYPKSTRDRYLKGEF